MAAEVAQHELGDRFLPFKSPATPGSSRRTPPAAAGSPPVGPGPASRAGTASPGCGSPAGRWWAGPAASNTSKRSVRLTGPPAAIRSRATSRHFSMSAQRDVQLPVPAGNAAGEPLGGEVQHPAQVLRRHQVQRSAHRPGADHAAAVQGGPDIAQPGAGNAARRRPTAPPAGPAPAMAVIQPDRVRRPEPQPRPSSPWEASRSLPMTLRLTVSDVRCHALILGAAPLRLRRLG